MLTNLLILYKGIAFFDFHKYNVILEIYQYIICLFEYILLSTNLHKLLGEVRNGIFKSFIHICIFADMPYFLFSYERHKW